MPYPSTDVVVSVSDYLNKKYKGNYWIWNIGEHHYDTKYFNDQVNFSVQNFSSPSFKKKKGKYYNLNLR